MSRQVSNKKERKCLLLKATRPQLADQENNAQTTQISVTDIGRSRQQSSAATCSTHRTELSGLVKKALEAKIYLSIVSNMVWKGFHELNWLPFHRLILLTILITRIFHRNMCAKMVLYNLYQNGNKVRQYLSLAKKLRGIHSIMILLSMTKMRVRSCWVEIPHACQTAKPTRESPDSHTWQLQKSLNVYLNEGAGVRNAKFS